MSRVRSTCGHRHDLAVVDGSPKACGAARVPHECRVSRIGPSRPDASDVFFAKALEVVGRTTTNDRKCRGIMISKPVSVIGAELAHHMFRDPPPTSPETLYHPTITVTERQLAI